MLDNRSCLNCRAKRRRQRGRPAFLNWLERETLGQLVSPGSGTRARSKGRRRLFGRLPASYFYYDRFIGRLESVHCECRLWSTSLMMSLALHVLRTCARSHGYPVTRRTLFHIRPPVNKILFGVAKFIFTRRRRRRLYLGRVSQVYIAVILGDFLRPTWQEADASRRRSPDKDLRRREASASCH